jgi:flagellin-like hook-associated protein FlgL
MTSIIPIPTTRVSDLYISQRLLAQIQFDQQDLLRLQTQISTGRRINLPSEDAPAAVRAIGLQSLLERKTQVRINLQTNDSNLSASDTALSGASNLLNEMRGLAISVTGTTSSDTQRETAALEVERAIQQLVAIGNQRFRGRYLFAGSMTTLQPFDVVDENVIYHGNELALFTNSDLNLLFETNLDGNAVFGAVSEPVKGTVDLNPILTPESLMADLRGGEGIQAGSVAVSDGTNSSIVDLSGAETIGDVAALLEENPPLGRTVTVDVTSTGLTVTIDGGNLSIREVGGGTTANELGILREIGIGALPIVGTDLNPQLTLTTPLRNILGVRAQAAITSAGSKNDLLFEASLRGPAFNGITVSYVDGGIGTAGSETAVYDSLAGTLTVTIESGVSTANQIITAVNAEGTFTARWNPREFDNDGTGTVLATAADATATAVTAGGSGIEFDQGSGLQIINGDNTYTINFPTAETVEDLLNVLNGSPAGLLAQINATGTGIDVRSRISGGDFTIGENGGSTATELGLRSFTTATRLEDLNYGVGIHEVAGNDFTIRRKDGIEFSIDVAGAATINDVLNLINSHASNQDPLHRVTAGLVALGNGIQLSTDDASATATFAVLPANLSQTAQDLGLIPRGAAVSDPAVVSGTTETILGRDVNPLEVHGVFQALTRLRDALRADDVRAIERAIELLDEGTLDLNFARSELGARQQYLDTLEQRLDVEEITLRESLSLDLDVDIVEAISSLTSRQTAFEAALRAAAQVTHLSLLNFL